MVVAAVSSLVPLLWVELRDLSWPDPQFKKLALIDLGFVIFFAIELAVRFSRATDKKKFVRENWYEVLGLVPLYAEGLAWLRATRVFRLFRVFRAVRALRALSFIGKVFRESHLGLIVTIAAGLVLTLATAFYFIERGGNPNMQSFGDAVWWAMTTTTTVGYGDIVPRTTGGRVIAGVLMVTGVAFFGVVASSLTTAIASIGKQDDSLDALLRRHEDLVVRRERGELDDEAFATALRDLVTLHRK
jgi:voltage-gated potassium channel